jgi:hypothetical protein
MDKKTHQTLALQLQRAWNALTQLPLSPEQPWTAVILSVKSLENVGKTMVFASSIKVPLKPH